MIKRIAGAALAGSLLVAGTAAKADNTGCGLGSMLWEGQSGIAQSSLAVTTNGISFNQLFGITTGTLGCQPNATITAEATQFMTDNMDQVARDMSNGGGEALDTLAELMDIDASDRDAFISHAQENFGEIFPSEDVTAGEALNNLESTMAEDITLSRYTV